MTYSTILYYRYTSVADPVAEMQYQRELSVRLGLLGRIIIAHEGINGTLSGTVSACKEYMKVMSSHPIFAGVEFKIDETEVVPFPKLSVKVRDEIVTLGRDVDPADTAPRLTPQELNTLLEQEPDVVMFDARNNYESAIGKFSGAVTPNIKLFKDLPDKLSDYEDLKDKTVVTYCTGGVRCEKASALMRQQGFKKVYQLDGGIIKYAQEFPEGAFDGRVFVFDGRMSVGYGKSPAVIGKCHFCASPAWQYLNCADKTCNNLTLRCDDCSNQVCSDDCEANRTIPVGRETVGTHGK